MPAKHPKTKGRCKANTCRCMLPCWDHCQDNPDSVLHEPDLSSARQADGALVGVLDFNCKHCGQSGSLRVKSEDVVFS